MTDADTLVRGMVEALSDSGTKAIPMATTDSESVVKAMLTENTGRHLLDSGGAYGRHFEENQESPPWDDPAYDVDCHGEWSDQGFVVMNVYDHLCSHIGGEPAVSRDLDCVALETALYRYGHSDESERSWLQNMKTFGAAVAEGELSEVLDPALEPEVRKRVLSVARSIEEPHAGSWNTYNGEFHTLSQILQGVTLGGPYGDFVLLQIHGGCDVRGGYTAPRVFRTGHRPVSPSEFGFYCESCGWSEAESCVAYNESADLLYVRGDEYVPALEDHGWTDDRGDTRNHPAVRTALERENIDGAVFHKCSDTDGDFGHVVF